ncbi:acetylglutamate kinase [Haloprofundus marisrubri]|uniref:Isopentenyl phosphate kinase n=1 Tax=Haloprofundus marisrubri TaxID=1514971 RepID=A0A0W1R6W4_9EURY|nr:isopentenyl phosphate kinase [Haloprofundus marisrubri]KTG08624.1 acetylglutamate kinase [Haloprofundus marisrubri]
MTVVLKLGGSVVTDKDTPETVDDDAIDAAVDAISESGVENLVVVHGGGSFGHHHAANYGVSTTEGTDDAAGALAIHAAMKRLNDAVVSRLQSRDVPALPVHPLSVAARRDAEGDEVGETDGAGASLSLPLESTKTLLGEGFVPVLHGDVVAHAGRGVTVVSGDELVVRLAADLDADRVGLCSTVPGVYDENETVVDEIRSFADVESALGESESTDVTGGMAAKVRALLAMDAPAHVFGPDGIGPFLAGASPGTKIDGR